jgi:hypothetical protein
LSAPLAATAAISIDGIWQTDGYDAIVAIDNSSARLHSTTTISCTPAGEFVRDGNRFTAEGEQAFTLRPTRGRVVFARR